MDQKMEITTQTPSLISNVLASAHDCPMLHDHTLARMSRVLHDDHCTATIFTQRLRSQDGVRDSVPTPAPSAVGVEIGFEICKISSKNNVMGENVDMLTVTEHIPLLL